MSLKYLQSAEHTEERRSSLKDIFSLKGTYDKSFKVIIIGDQFTGKTALLMRVGEGKQLKSYDATIGVDCRTRTFHHGKGSEAQKVRL